MAGQLIPVQGDPSASRDLGDPGHLGPGLARNDYNHGQPANRAQQAFFAQYAAAGGFDEHAPVGSARNPYGMFPQSPDPLRSGMPPNSYFVDFDGKIKQLAQDVQGGGNPRVVTIGSLSPVQGDPSAAEPKMGYGEDAARSLLPGVGNFAANTAALPGQIGNAVITGAKGGYGALQDAAGSGLGEPYMGSRGTQQMVYLDKNGAYQTTDAADLGMNALPSASDINTGLQHTFGPYHQPQHWTGRATETLGEFAPMALLPGGPIARGARVLLPTIGASAGGELTHGTAMEPYARAGGALLAGGLEGYGEGLGARPQTWIADATRGLTDRQVGIVAALREGAADRGINLSIPEAVQHVTNGATGLGRLQRLNEGVSATAPSWLNYYAGRPQQVRDAVTAYVDALDPSRLAPGMVAQDARQAAIGAQRTANSGRQALAGPHYQAADAQEIGPDEMANILRGVDGQIAGDKTGLIAPTLSRFRDSLTEQPASAGTSAVRTPGPVPGIYHMEPGEPAAPRVPITNIGDLSTARNYWRDAIDNPPVGTDALTKYQSGIIGGHLDALDALLRSNPNRQVADTAYAAASRFGVDPLNAGPVGRIAGAPNTAADVADLSGMTGALYPRNPPLGAPAETADAISALNQQNPTIGAQLTRQHIGNTFNQSTSDLTDGPNQYGGARFVRDLLGNDEQAATLHSGLNAIDPSGGASEEMATLADILRATGRRERPGSMTANNQADQAAMSIAPKALNLFNNPLEWGEHLKHAAGMALYRSHGQQLADLLRSPDTLAVLQQARAMRSMPAISAIRSAAPAALQLESQGN